MILKHYSNNGYDSVVLENNDGVVVGAWSNTPDAIHNFYDAALRETPLSEWEENYDEWRPQEGIDVLVAEYDDLFCELEIHEPEMAVRAIKADSSDPELIAWVTVAADLGDLCAVCDARDETALQTDTINGIPVCDDCAKEARSEGEPDTYYAVYQDSFVIMGVGRTPAAALVDAMQYADKIELDDEIGYGNTRLAKCSKALYEKVCEHGGDVVFDVHSGIVCLSDEVVDD